MPEEEKEKLPQPPALEEEQERAVASLPAEIPGVTPGIEESADVQ